MNDNDWLLKPNGYEDLNDRCKFLNIDNRMDSMYGYVKRKPWRKRFASTEQFAEEYTEERDRAVTVAFILLKREYDEIRDFVLNDKVLKKNPNALILEKILESDIEQMLTGNIDE